MVILHVGIWLKKHSLLWVTLYAWPIQNLVHIILGLFGFFRPNKTTKTTFFDDFLDSCAEKSKHNIWFALPRMG